MVREAGKLSKLQVGETILEKENCTIHTDGTSKGGGRHYSGLQVSTDAGSLSAGLTEIVSGTAANYFDAVKSVFEECERLLDLRADDNSITSTLKQMLANCKNLMSDKHVVETRFTGLFRDFHEQYLPSVING